MAAASAGAMQAGFLSGLTAPSASKTQNVQHHRSGKCSTRIFEFIKCVPVCKLNSSYSILLISIIKLFLWKCNNFSHSYSVFVLNYRASTAQPKCIWNFVYWSTKPFDWLPWATTTVSTQTTNNKRWTNQCYKQRFKFWTTTNSELQWKCCTWLATTASWWRNCIYQVSVVFSFLLTSSPVLMNVKCKVDWWSPTISEWMASLRLTSRLHAQGKSSRQLQICKSILRFVLPSKLH